MRKLTENFSFEELTHTNYKMHLIQNRIDAEAFIENLQITANALQFLRDRVGFSLIVSSGFRNDELNAKVKGSSTSTHKIGLAADIVSRSVSTFDLFQFILNNHTEFEMCFRKVIYEKFNGREWIHIQARTSTQIEHLEFFEKRSEKGGYKVVEKWG